MQNYCKSREWRELRRSLLSSLDKAIRENKVDSDILDLLEVLNSIYCIATTSSCSGRIAVFSAPLPGDKKHGGIIEKWHRSVSLNELIAAINKAIKINNSFIWASAQPVIITLHACSFHVAAEILAIAERTGFKYSGLKIAKNSFYITILGTERVDIPIRINSNVFIDVNDVSKLRSVMDILNTYLSLAKKKLTRLKRAVAANAHILGSICEEATLP